MRPKSWACPSPRTRKPSGAGTKRSLRAPARKPEARQAFLALTKGGNSRYRDCTLRCDHLTRAELPSPASIQEQTRAVACARNDLGMIRRLAQAEHHGALRLHDHHAPQHFDGDCRVLDCDVTTVA